MKVGPPRVTLSSEWQQKRQLRDDAHCAQSIDFNQRIMIFNISNCPMMSCLQSRVTYITLWGPGVQADVLVALLTVLTSNAYNLVLHFSGMPWCTSWCTCAGTYYPLLWSIWCYLYYASSWCPDIQADVHVLVVILTALWCPVANSVLLTLHITVMSWHSSWCTCAGTYCCVMSCLQSGVTYITHHHNVQTYKLMYLWWYLLMCEVLSTIWCYLYYASSCAAYRF